MDRVWYSVKARNYRQHLSAGTDTQSLSVYELIAIHIFIGGPSPNFGKGVELGVWYGTL